MKKKVLILTGDAGFGHRSASNAIADALTHNSEFEFETKIENLLNHSSVPAWLQNTQSDYDKIVKDMPKFYEFSYESSDNPLPTQIASIGLSAILGRAYKQAIESFQPDLVVNTYPIYHGPAQSWYFVNEETWKTEFFTRNKINQVDLDLIRLGGKRSSSHDAEPRKHIPFITVVTDLVSVHLIWMSKMPDKYCVGTDEMKELISNYGIAPEKISVTGIPVKPVFALENRTKRQLRVDMGWDPDKTTILAMGSKRVSNLMGYLRAINHSGFDLQLILVAGGDEALYKQFIAEDWHIPVIIQNFANDIPSKLMACDMVIAKAGGLITSESLAAGAPMLIVDVIPGQEEGNAAYVQANQTGAIVNDPIAMLETVAHWLMDDAAELKRITENVKRIGKPRSSLEVADIIASCLRQQPARNLLKVF